ncbi:MAG: tyrosine-type recombinase/integrase [Acidimicrobiales bacterium]
MRGHIHKRQWKGRGGKVQVLWYVVVDIGQDDDGRRQQKWHGGFKTRRDAENALADLVRSLDKQTYITPQHLSLAEFARDEWLPTMQTQVKHSTWDSYRRNLDLHVLPVLGGTQLQQVTAGQLNGLYRSLLASGHRNGISGLAPKTVRNIHIAVSKLLADAVDRGLVGRNIATSAKAPKPRKTGPTEICFWTPQELSAFLHFMKDDRLYALWHLAAMTGMRRGELLGLRWEDIDCGAKRVAVRQAVISVAYEVRVTTPKSHSARVIDLDPQTVDVLRRHRLAQDAERIAGGDAYADNDRVFRKADGAVIHPDVMRTMFDRRVKRSGVKRIRFHDLRHTHATIGLRAGVPVKVMSERLGHATPAFTLQQYAHVIPGMQAEAAQAIADLVAEVPGKPAPKLVPSDDEGDGGDDIDA